MYSIKFFFNKKDDYKSIKLQLSNALKENSILKSKLTETISNKTSERLLYSANDKTLSIYQEELKIQNDKEKKLQKELHKYRTEYYKLNEIFNNLKSEMCKCGKSNNSKYIKEIKVSFHKNKNIISNR